MNLNQLQEEERLFIAKIDDLFKIAAVRNIPKYFGFLHEREHFLAEECVRQRKYSGARFWGGYDAAERVMLAALPDYMEQFENREAGFPLYCIRFQYPPRFTLSHRDFLGALMHLNITRECIGDILIDEGQAYIFVREQTAPLIIDELRKVGSVGVKAEITKEPVIKTSQEFDELSGTVHSVRLDAIVSLATRLSRQKSCELIDRGLVQVQHQSTEKYDRLLKVGEVFSIRGYGKFCISEVNGPTKKGRLRVQIRKYR